MSYQTAILKPGKEKPLLQQHHWIFSGALHFLPAFENGDFLAVHSSSGRHLGYAYFNKKSGLVGRMVSFDETPPLAAIEHSLEKAYLLRKQLFANPQTTNAFRLINGEGDKIPGLVIDIYGSVAVIQSGTLGIDKVKDEIAKWILKNLPVNTIYEKSILPTRKEEGIAPRQGFLAGSEKDEISFLENGITFTTSLSTSQKTGFFLDHREMRQWIGELAKNKTVLNTFCYTGGFSLFALKNGAKKVTSVDCSSEAIERAKNHTTLNHFDLSKHRLVCEDVFEFLRNDSMDYDLAILDPPAFAKKQKDVIQACRGYKEINRLAIAKLPPGSFLLTCSCSYHVDELLFQKVLFQAALEAKRNVRIVGKHHLAPDHPINLYHPETNYLKSFLLAIE